MATTPRWGLTLPLQSMPLHEQRDIVAGLPDLGYTDAWSAEVNGSDAFTPLALAAQWAGELRLGTAIVPVYTRGPGLLAMSGATLAGLAPGRFVLGIGTSSPVVVQQWNAVEFARPYQRARDMLRFLRQALAGEKVTQEYETFRVDGFRLDPAPETPPRLALAALRPQMIKLAAAEADAAITNWLAPGDVPQVRAAAGPDCELVEYLRLPHARRRAGPRDRQADDRRLHDRARLRRVPRLAGPGRGHAADAGGVGGGRPQGRPG